RLVLLGTGTCQLEDGRAASSVLVELDGLRLLFDCGRGVAARLAELGYRQDELRHVVISHFHADHVSDLVPLLQAGSWSRTDPRSRDLHIWGPPGLRRLIEGWFELYGPGRLVNPDGFAVELHELPAGRFSIEGCELEFVSLPPAGNHGLGFTVDANRYALTGDSDLHRQEIDFLSGCELAVFDSGHLSEEEIVELAASSQARRLVCSHLYRPLDAGALNARAAKAGYTGELVVGEDRMSFAL
ncbi:MAG: MBL fold metallo-hydrolase, partial [Thermoanaerobaculia bacterium]